MTIIITTDSTHQLSVGRGPLLFTIPIVAASFLLKPYASFIWAFVCSLIITLLAFSIHVIPYTVTADPLHDHAEEIKKAGEHSAVITRQLLIFSRKQSVIP